jgi:tetratricopeptide (TPR) repeat protein
MLRAQEQFELALRSGQGLRLDAELTSILMDEMALSLLGVSRCLIHKQEHRAALTLLEEAYAREVFSSLTDPQPQSERLLLLGEIHLELGEAAEALSCAEKSLAHSNPGDGEKKAQELMERVAGRQNQDRPGA